MDAFKKGFFGFHTFSRELRERGVGRMHRDRLEDLFDMARLTGAADPGEAAIRSWLREMQDVLIEAATESFTAHYRSIMSGNSGKELISAKDSARLLHALKGIAYDYAFTSASIFRTEIAANRIMNYLLDNLVPAALCFDSRPVGLMEEKFLSLIPVNYKLVCRKTSDGAPEADRLYARLQMAADTVSGMTDSYARDLYSELTGLL